MASSDYYDDDSDNSFDLLAVTPWSGKSGGVGNTITGTVVYRSEAVDDYHHLGVTVIVRSDVEGLKRIYSWGTVLRTELWRADPQVGDLLTVAYLGEKRGRRRNYSVYEVLCDKRPRPVHRREATTWDEANALMDAYPEETGW